MAVSAKMYGLAHKSAWNKEIHFDGDTLKIALFTSSLSINQDTNQYFDAAPYTSNQVAGGNGYTTGGYTVSPGSMSYDSGTNKLSFDVGNATWTSATFTCRYGILYDDTPASNKPLICYIDFGADQSPNNGTLTITIDPTGIAYVTVA